MERISKTPGVCGGDACVRGTRLSVWGLVESRRLGLSDAELLQRHPGLTPPDLEAAWDYAAGHPNEIERALWENEACMVEHDGRHVSRAILVRGRQLGLLDEEIRTAFVPPLEQDILEAAWR